MRPKILHSLFSDIQYLKGIGPKLAERFAKLCGRRIIDLVFLKPSGIIDRRHTPKITEVQDGEIASFIVKIISHEKPFRRSMPYKVICENESGFLTLVFFNVKGDYLEKSLPVGAEKLISGRMELLGNARQIAHPDIIANPEDAGKILRLEPQYPLTAGITSKTIHRAFAQIIPKLPELPEWQKKPQISWKNAIIAIHNPGEKTEIAQDRLAYDELLALQITQNVVRQQITKVAGAKIQLEKEFYNKFLAALPFQFTRGQQMAVDEIFNDMQSGNRMFRLLQGDVGSGKTAVALAAIVLAAGNNKQSVMMMPTTLLAIQQKNWIEKVTAPLGLRTEILTSNEKGKQREEILERLKNGEIDILVGTHALFQDWVEFKNLALAVIDEQHRFGVEQRLKLSRKNEQAHILLMTATPIPRTLTLALYGDMEVSRILEKPAGRQKIETLIIPESKLESAIESIGRAMEKGEKIYWICPLVEESEKIDLTAATDRYEFFRRKFGDTVGLVHGRLKEEEKNKVLQKFISGEHQLLVATKVVEVGIDVRDATIMFIEHAERFGLSQLHQLRGRVGRGEKKSTCILIYSGNPGETSKRRLMVMKEHDDGFRIAEEDLNIRGGGDTLGTRQSGFKFFRFAEFPKHSELLEQAHKEAQTAAISENIKLLLSLLEYDESISYLNAG